MIYCEQADVEAIFGAQNVADWARRDDNDSIATLTALITAFRTWASAEFDDYAAVQGYTIPLVTIAGATPTTVKYWSAALAGILLYESKGAFDIDERAGQQLHRYTALKERAYQVLAEIQNGKRHIDANPKGRT